ncbi:ABC transporter permease [Phytoactinopolyspora limicola]|uniref:ABC transporter permease n=1 Tax=Phytoactinopolyspora limicola TaxID=2715536 RepID=UPI00140C1088|nr:ABC transporter permease [Phytoactinopolyspora limicola]
MQRLGYLGRRLGYVLITLWGVSLLLFVMLQLLPGGPAEAMLGITATQQQVDALNQELGLDRPVVAQYVDYMGRLIRGDLGDSLVFGRPVVDVIGDALPATLKLAVYVVALSTLSTVTLATLAASFRGRAIDHVIRALPLIGVGMPGFWIGAMLLFLFALTFPFFPAGGIEEGFAGALRSLFLPALTLAISVSAILIRSLRRGLIDVLESDHVLTARAKGLRGVRLVVRHVLPNAAIPTVTLMGLVFVSLLGGALIVESVFAIPGVGQLLVNGFKRHDMPLVMGIALLSAAAILLVNLLIDVVYSLLDPRVSLR